MTYLAHVAPDLIQLTVQDVLLKRNKQFPGKNQMRVLLFSSKIPTKNAPMFLGVPRLPDFMESSLFYLGCGYHNPFLKPLNFNVCGNTEIRLDKKMHTHHFNEYMHIPK